MTKCVFIDVDKDRIVNIDIDIDPKKNEIVKALNGKSPTFVGQLVDTNVVIIKSVESHELNNNKLPYPFHTEIVHGPMILIHMDDNADPQDFTVEEYMLYCQTERSRTSQTASYESQEGLEL